MPIVAPPPGGEKTYTIDIPGLADVFKLPIPILETPELKRERINRMKTRVSPVPEILQWIPPVITKIDDAQDLLTTALWLAKPLIRRLPSRFVPYVGWALLASDISNIITTILSLAMTPGLTKPEIHKKVRDTKWSKAGRIARVAEYLRPSGWRRKLGDYLQAAQAAETVTGSGLVLGAIMGTLSDSIYGAIRAAAGQKVEIRLPPEHDLFGKACRYLIQTPQQYHERDILSPEDHELIVAAHNVAVGIVMPFKSNLIESRGDLLLETEYPVFMPWETSSIRVLKEEGFDLGKENYYKPYIPKDKPTFSDAIDLAWSSTLDYDAALRTEIGSGERGSILYMAWREAGLDSLNFLWDLTEEELLAYSPEQRACLKMSEYNFMLTPPYTQKNLEELIYVAMTIATTYGRIYPDIRQFIDAADALGLKWQKKY